MSHIKLIHDMKKRKISNWIIDWISSFLFDRFMILAMNRKRIESFSMQIEISQNSSFSSILYLFYNVDLLKMCNKFETNTRFFEYVDDVNKLIYEKSIDENCRNLERMHKLCERWAIRHEFVFVSIKYELIHFIRNSKKFDMTITIKIDLNTIQSKIDIRVFDVQIDTRLKWDSHVRKIQKKNDATDHNLHETVDFHLRSDFSQNSNAVHLRCSFDFHLRRLCLTHAQE
jgi:hypothetical protein